MNQYVELRRLAGMCLGALALSLGLLAGCATSPPGLASDRERTERGCLLASLGFNSTGTLHLPFDIDRDVYQHCVEMSEGRSQPPSSGIQVP